MGFLKEIVGHEVRLIELQKDIAENNLSHAYLFSGPSNVGKFTIARKMAKILQCPNGASNGSSGVGGPCGECSTCKEIERGTCGDMLEIPDNGESVKINEIRELLNKVNLSKQSNYKTVLIKNIERMTLEAANALLKTLEDPPKGVVFLLTTARLKEVLPTIISRVRHLKFGALKNEELSEFIKNSFPLEESGKIEMAVEFAEGKPGKAIEYMQNTEASMAYQKMFEDLRGFIKKPDLAGQFQYVSDLVKNAKEEEDKGILENFLENFLAALRVEMSEALNVSAGPMPAEKAAFVSRTVKTIKEVQKAQALLKNNINTNLLLENLRLSLNE